MNVPLILLSVCLNCAAQLLMKKGMAKIGANRADFAGLILGKNL